MTDFMDHLKHIPPWGYALIAAGVLGLSLFVGKKNAAQNSGGVTQTIAPVDPSAETAANDSLNRMQDMYNQLGAKYDQSVQNDANMQAGINYLNQQIKDLKSATPPSIVAIPSSPIVNHPAPTQSHPAPTQSHPAPHSSSPKRMGSQTYATPYGGWNSNSVVDYIKSKGGSSSFGSRSRLASQYGISHYRGTASQNTDLLHKLKSVYG